MRVLQTLLIVAGFVALGAYALRTKVDRDFHQGVANSMKSLNEGLVRRLGDSDHQIDDLERQIAAREAEFARQLQEIRQREAAIAGREDAATERTQSSFQGLMIQQQLTQNLEALKASLPNMTPEIEKLAKEHAQLGAERQRLEKENADLRRRLNRPDSPAAR